MKKRGGKRQPLKKEEVAEDWCFVCKEGGDLLICDYGECLKAYHTHCVGKEDSFLTSDERWNCDWHRCFICKKSSSFYCHCCPKGVCRRCIHSAEFVVVRRNHGFCGHCLKLALLIEENKDVDSDGETVDFKDLKTYEGLFMDYYRQLIQGKKGLTLDDLRTAKKKFKAAKFDSDAESVDDGDDEEKESDYESEDTTEDLKPKRGKEIKSQPPMKNPKNAKSKKMEFTGWGSTTIIQFLESIGQDTGKELNQRQVETLIIAYVKKHVLFDPEKKRNILCDEKLRDIFGRKVINRGKIYSMLEPHFANNLEESEEESEEEEENAFTTGAEDEDTLLPCKKKRKLKEEKASPKDKPVPCAPQSCFAAITAENIKLIYLRRTLVQELSSKEPESFENKVMGCFVRVTTNPYDYSRRNSHELLQVTGAKKSSTGEQNTEMILLVSKMPPEIRMSSLSDCDFEEAECEDLKQRVKDGVIPKLIVVELQEKASSLHEDITNNWINRELRLLDIYIERALEKGWRRELLELKERRQLLQTKEERSRLLATVPYVSAEELDPVNEEDVHNKKENEASPSPVDRGWKRGGSSGTSVDHGWKRGGSSGTSVDHGWKWGDSSGTSTPKKYPGQASGQRVKQTLRDTFLPLSPDPALNGKTSKTIAGTREGNKEMHSSSVNGTEQDRGVGGENTPSRKQEPIVDKNVADLTSDGESNCRDALRKQNLEDPENRVWHIVGPDGERKGKFSLSLLKDWSEKSAYALKYKAWRESETEEQAIWLGDALKLAYDGK